MANVTNVYLHVIDDVMKNVQADFQSEGVEDNVLQELQALWELKLMESGAIAPAPAEIDQHVQTSSHVRTNTNANATRANAIMAHDLNMPYVPAEEEFKTRDLLQAAAPVHTPQAAKTQYQSMPYPANERGVVDLEPTLGRPQPFMAKPEHWEQKQTRGVDLNSAFEPEPDDEGEEEGDGVTQNFFSPERKRRRLDGVDQGYIPQVDGSNDEDAGSRQLVGVSLSSPVAPKDHGRWLKRWKMMMKGRQSSQIHQQQSDELADKISASTRLSGSILQVDGEDDDEDGYEDDGQPDEDDQEPDEEVEEEEDYNDPGEPAATPALEPTPLAAREEAEEDVDDEPPLGADDDEEDVDDPTTNSQDPITDHFVLATYDKVTRSKNKWKCVLKDGIMHLNGRDILFFRATGDFEF